jgi:hypothetical protein
MSEYEYRLPRPSREMAASEMLPPQRFPASSHKEAWEKAERMFGAGGTLYLVIPKDGIFPSEDAVHGAYEPPHGLMTG